MYKFEFKQNLVDLEIGGITYNINLGEGSLEAKVEKIRENAVEYAKKLTEIESSKDEEVIEKTVVAICEFTKQSVDELLGESAYDSIFRDRQRNMLDNIDLLAFLLDSIAEEMKNYKAQYQNKYSPARISADTEEKQGKGKTK